MTRGDKLIRAATVGFPAKYCTGVSHYLLSQSGAWTLCESYVKIDHTQCKKVVVGVEA